MQWGLDIVGPMPKAPGQKRFLLVATDYFSKWIEAETYKNIKDADLVSFVWKHIVCRFGLPRIIVSDNGSQFISKKFKHFCDAWEIQQRFSTPRHPQGNGQAEASNKTILGTLKKRLDDAKGKWADELLGVLWSYRTTIRTGTNATPFSLVFGTEAVIPAEIAERTARTSENLLDSLNDQLRRHTLDETEETREAANIRLAHYQQKAAQYYNAGVKARQFQVGDLVLRRVNQNTQEPSNGKLGPTWEGPYRVTAIPRPGAYRLQNVDNDTDVLRSCNSEHLRVYHSSSFFY